MIASQRTEPHLRLAGTFAAGVFAMGLLTAGPSASAADKLPPTIYFASGPSGSLQHTFASAIAKVVSAATPTTVVVRPYTGTTAFFPLVASGEVELAMATAVDFAMSYRGPDKLKISGRNPYPHIPQLRLVASGAPLVVGLLVRKGSKIKTVHDLKGHSIAGEFPAHLGAYVNTYAQLLNAGLNWKDVKVVRVAGLGQGVAALDAGRVEVATMGVGAPKVRELDSKFGIRHVSNDCTPAAKKRVTDKIPGYGFVTLKPGRLPGIVGDTCLTAYPLGIVTSAKTPDVVVAAVAKALYENSDKLGKFHPALRRWKKSVAVSMNATVPYHEAAVATFKSLGVWNAKMDEKQAALLKEGQ